MTGRAIIVHSVEQARAALAAAAALRMPLALRSAPGAAAYLGAAVFREMIAQAAADYPEVPLTAALDCGDDPGLALNALRQGIKIVRIHCPAEVRTRLANIAGQWDAVLDDDDPALDLLDEADPLAASQAWLGSG